MMLAHDNHTLCVKLQNFYASSCMPRWHRRILIHYISPLLIKFVHPGRIMSCWGRILCLNPEKSLKSLPPCYSQSHRQLCLEISISSNSRNLLRIPTVQLLYNRGLKFYTFFGISIGITRRMIDIGKKNNILLFAKCLKM